MKTILISLTVLIVVVVAVGVVTPKDYSVVSTVTIQAPPERVHEYLGDLKRWPEWAPWHEEDPTIVTTFGPTTTGAGASQTWTGDSGDGELTFTRSDPKSGISYDMAFLSDGERFPATVTIDYADKGGATEITWVMEGSWKGIVPPVMDGWMKLMTPWMIGGSFDRGLANLKAVVEAG
ncbi:MAG: SRPBCC family protein [Xanthomonadales bacterium]|nr:SRPBCC family protein [Xanthomonadales bacterium]